MRKMDVTLFIAVLVINLAVPVVLAPSAQSEPEDNRAIVLLIDKSGSMREENRIEYVKEAAKAITRKLNDADLIGVIAFDVDPFVLLGKCRPLTRFDRQSDRSY
jgi:Mg-chelatase subunit ChlD